MSKKLTTKIFIQKSNMVHNSFYNYTESKYISSQIKVRIICPEHGEFEQTPNTHLAGSGCKKCGIIRRAGYHKKSVQQFIAEARNIHGNKYDYSSLTYKGIKNKIEIICKEHGAFKQNADDHKRGSNCPICVKEYRKINSVGWTSKSWKKLAEESKNFDSFKVYIIRCWNDDEEFYKIGKTFKTLKNRFKSFKKMPYNFEIVQIFEGKAKDMSSLERKLQKENKNNQYVPKLQFNGMYECFKNII